MVNRRKKAKLLMMTLEWKARIKTPPKKIFDILKVANVNLEE